MEAEMDVENDSNALNINKADIRRSPIKNDCNVLKQDKTENRNEVQKYDNIKPKLENSDVLIKNVFKTNSDVNNDANILQNQVSFETQNEKTEKNTKSTKKARRRLAVIDSDSDSSPEAMDVDEVPDNVDEISDNVDEAPETTSNRRPNFLDSDDENSHKPSRDSESSGLATKKAVVDSEDSTSNDNLENPELSSSRRLALFEADRRNSRTKPKRSAILDSDEDDEASVTSSSTDKPLGEDNVGENSTSSSMRKPLEEDNDDENSTSFSVKSLEEDEDGENSTSSSVRKPSGEDNVDENSTSSTVKKQSSEEGMDDEENCSFSKAKPKKLAILDSDSGEESLETHSKEKKSDEVLKSDFLKSRLSNLCDSESSEDEREINMRAADKEDEESAIRPTKYKKKPKKEDPDKPKKMSAKDAAEQRREIESESQRMMRERHVSLPYHRPKQRSLKEFLQKRSKFASAVPSYAGKASPSLAIKMSKNQIKEMTKKIEEREKEVQEFFKSESEESEGENEDDKSENDATKVNDNEVTQVTDNEPTENGTEISEQNEDSINKQLTLALEEAEITETTEKATHLVAFEGEKESTTNLPNNVEEGINSEESAFNLLKQAEDNDRSPPEHGENNLPKNGEVNDLTKNNSLGETNLLGGEEIGANLNGGEEIAANLLGGEEIGANLPGGEEIGANLLNSGEENTSNPLKLREENVFGQNLLGQREVNILCQREEHIFSQIASSLVRQEEITNSNLTEEHVLTQREEGTSKLVPQEDSGSPLSESVAVKQIEKEEESIFEQMEDGDDISGKTPAEKCITILRVDTIHPATSAGNAVTCRDLEEETAMDCDFNSDEPGEEIEDTLEKNTGVKKPTRMELLKEQLGDTMPKLSGGPNFVIDLEEGVTKPDEVSQLMERFVKHTSKKKQHKSKVELSVVSVTSAGVIHQEKLAVKVDDNEQPEIIEKPGVKLKKLRDELQQQMAERRSRLWQQKLNRSTEEKGDDEESAYKDEKSECGVEEDNLLDNEEEEDLTDPESSEDEIEEDDVQLVEKKRPKCALIDEEADEDNELEEADLGVEADEDDDAGDADAEEEMEEDEQEEPVEFTKKPMRRIIQTFDDDDDSDEEIAQTKENLLDANANKDKDLDSTDPLDDDYFIPPGQPRGSQTPARQRTQTKSDLLCLTPVIHLTGLQSLNSGSKFLHESPGSPAIKLTEPSPVKGNNCQKKLLFETQPECNQEELEALAELCSGKFPTQTQVSEPTQLQLSEDPPTTQDLADLCSGQFTGISGIVSRSPGEVGANRSYENIELQTTKKIESLIDDNDDRIITQLLNEEELQEFRKKFESPIVSGTQGGGKVQTPGIAARIDFDSDDDDDDDEEEIVVKKRKQHAIVDSDDENNPVEQEEEGINLHDEDDDDCLDGEDPEREKDEFSKDVEYDSEENEIDINSKEAPKKVKLKDFFENEAELSESEWGSADEDEKDLDTLEIELGDEDKFDQDKVRKELERIHMRQVLDEDNREIKILQEMLLEDGELHGTGRQKQFRWKNVDMTINDNADAKDDDENVTYDDENDEEEWRKKRYEREIFLRKQTEKSSQDIEDTDISLTVNSQVFQLGQKARIKTTNSQSITIEKTVVERKVPFSLLSQRGSFLARPEQDLQRVAEYTRPATTSVNGVGGPKKSKHYLFQKINSEPTAGSVEDKKRKAAGQGTPLALKKIRLNGLSPAEKPKPEKNTNRVKRLFSNW